MGYEVVAYTPAYDRQIAQLQTHLWSNDAAFNARYLRWKYAENPYLHDALIRIALHEGQPVAMRGLFGTMWEVDGGVRYLLPYADDFVVAPAHRNRGPAGLVLKAALDASVPYGLSYAVSLSAGPVTYVSSLAAGWRAVGSYESMRRSEPPTRWMRGWTALRRRIAATHSSSAYARFDRSIGHRVGPISAARDARSEDMAHLIARLPWDGRIRHVRDAEYLAWRFRNPMSDYRFLYWDEGDLLGYLVLQCSGSDRGDRTCVNISDWEATDERVRAGLLQAALDRGHFARLDAWTVSVDEGVVALLRRHGFAPVAGAGLSARSSGLLVRHLGAERPPLPWMLGQRRLLDIADWDLRMLYSMAG